MAGRVESAKHRHGAYAHDSVVRLHDGRHDLRTSPHRTLLPAVDDASRISGGNNDGETAVVISYEDIVRSVSGQKRVPPPAIPNPLRGKFNTVNFHSLVSVGDRDVVLDSALKDACLGMLRDASVQKHVEGQRICPHSTKGMGAVYIADAGAMHSKAECW